MYRILIVLCLIFAFFSKLSAQTNPAFFLYTITAEDKSLWGICHHHSVTVEVVKELNNLKRNSIKVGKQLKIPMQTQVDAVEGTIIYVVSEKDKSLWAICRKYAVTVDTVLKLNKLETSGIKKGQQLIIPVSHLVIHTVVKADKSIWRISKNYGVDLAELKEFNNKKNNIIRRGDKILIPKEWITKTEILIKKEQDELSSMWQKLNKPVFNLTKEEDKFPFKERKSFRIDENILNDLAVKHKLSKVEYVRLFQQSTQRSSIFYNSFNFKDYKNLYYYSVEQPFLIDLSSLDYYPLAAQQERNIEDGYAYDFVTVIEVDTARNSIEILPVFLYRAYFGNVDKYFGAPLKGAFSCCASPHPLAHYSKTDKKETIGFSELIQPSVLKYTEVNKRLQDGNIIQVDSTILILQFESFDIPTLIDIEEYKNGRMTQGFIRAKRRKKLGY
jgi:LysM repeat protein